MALFIDRLHLRNETDGTFLELTNVMEGADGAATFGYNVEQNTIRVKANQTQPISEAHSLAVMVVDDRLTSPQALLTEWANSPTDQFRASAFGGDSFLIWDTPVNLTIPRQFDQIVTRKLGLTLTALPGYSGIAPLTKLPVYAGQNALSLYKVDQGSASFLNGFAQGGDATLTVSQANGIQTAVVTSTDDSYLYSLPFVFPFEDVKITASINVTTYSVTGNSQIGFEWLDSTGVSMFTSLGSFSGTGRKSFTTTIPAGAYYVQMFVGPNTSVTFGSPTLSFNTPAIRLDGESTYIY